MGKLAGGPDVVKNRIERLYLWFGALKKNVSSMLSMISCD